MRAAGLDLSLPASHLQRAAADGDPAAVAAFDVGSRALGTAIANAVNLIDVENVVLGGIYAELAEQLVPGIERVLRDRVLVRAVVGHAGAGGRGPRGRRDDRGRVGGAEPGHRPPQ